MKGSPAPVRLRKNAADEEILAFAREWVDVVSTGDYERALAMTEHYPTVPPVKILKDAIETLGRIGKKGVTYRVTPVRSAAPDPGHPFSASPGFVRQDISRSERDGHALTLDFSLPINGYWSDLTARFSFVVDGEELVVYLDDVLIP